MNHVILYDFARGAIKFRHILVANDVFVVAVSVRGARSGADRAEVEREVAALLDKGASVRDAAAALKARGVSRRTVYEIARKLRG